MLCIPTYVAPSGIHGLGLYAARALEPGTLVWRFDSERDLVLSSDALASLPAVKRQRLRSYCYEHSAGVLVLCGDDAIFMNHHDRPNCDDPGPTVTIARRAIAAGEELTVDYRLFDRAADRWLPSDGHSAEVEPQ